MDIEFKDVTVGYGKQRILENINFRLSTGEIINVLGSNGIGKSTIFKTILGGLLPLEGVILIDGIDIRKIPVKIRSKIIAYVPQAKDYSYQFLVKDILLMGRNPHIKNFSIPGRSDYFKVEEILQYLKIGDLKNKVYSELSGGQQQMVLLGRAIVQESQFLILDEPASNLDFYNQKKMLEIIKELSEKKVGILMATHSPEHAFICNDKAMIILKNQKYAFGNVSEVVNKENLTAAFEVPIEIIEKESNGKLLKSSCISI